MSDSTTFDRVSRHTLRQLKFVLPGAVISYWLDPFRACASIAQSGAGKWGRTSALASLGAGVLTVALFLYILLLPTIKGVQPNYRQWRETGELASVIPLLTASIVSGWSLLSFTLAQYADLGLLEGVIASVGAYMLTLGVVGLVPVPKANRR